MLARGMMTTFGVLLLAAVGLMVLPATAEHAGASDRPELGTASVRSGFQVYRPGRWGVVRSVVENPTEVVQRPLVSTKLLPREHVHFARRVWVPAGAEREVFTPVFTFEAGSDDQSVEAPTQLIVDDRGPVWSTPEHPSLLPVRGERMMTMHVGDWQMEGGSREMVRALRERVGLADAVMLRAGEDLPAQPLAWDVVDAISLSGQVSEIDALARDALRQWLVGGGRLWVMLENGDPAALSRLLGDSWDVRVQDRVSLHEFTLEGPAGETHAVESAHGVEMVRVFAPSAMEVVHRVDGYPASLRAEVGAGQLLVTTVGAEAWLEPDGSARDVLADLDSIFTGGTARPDAWQPEVGPAFQRYVGEQIGYTIMGRGVVASVLGVFVLALLVSGGVLAWRGRLEWIGGTGAVVALVATGGLVGLGTTHHAQRPLTVMGAQLLQTDPEQAYVRTVGATGVYVPPGEAGGRDRLTVRGAHGVLWPAGVERFGELTRLEWVDHDRWRYPRRSLPTGTVHWFTGESVEPIDEPVRAVMRFTDEGLAGSFTSGPFEALSDGVIATRGGQLPLAFTGETGEFRPGGSALGRRQFIGGGLLSDVQNRRQAVYRALADEGLMPAEPVVMGWTESAPTSRLRLEADEAASMHSLVMVPVRFERPEAGRRVTIPAALMDTSRPRPGEVPAAYVPGGLYSEETQAWVEAVNREATAVMRFKAPAGVGPLEVESATLSMHLRAPGWRYEVLVKRGDEVEVVAEGTNPLGEVEVSLTGEQAPEMEADGAVFAGLRLDRTGESRDAQWTLRRLDLSVTGVAVEPERE